MRDIDEKFLAEYCQSAGVKTDSGIAGQKFLKFRTDAIRIIVVHLAPADVPVYIRELLRRVLRADKQWLVVPRVQQPLFGVEWRCHESAGVLIEDSEHDEVIEHLISHLDGLWSTSNDLWLASKNANVILSWDHHMMQEGFNIFLSDMKASSELLCSLNELGAELELYSLREEGSSPSSGRAT